MFEHSNFILTIELSQVYQVIDNRLKATMSTPKVCPVDSSASSERGLNTRDGVQEPMSSTVDPSEIVLRGSSICPGIGIGFAHVVDRVPSVQPTSIDPGQVAAEQRRYTAAVAATLSQLHEHVAVLHGSTFPEAEVILGVHQAILRDESFHDQVRKRIAAELKSAEWCLWQKASDLIAQFSTMRNPYFEARGEDIRDMGHNLIDALSGEQSEPVASGEREQVRVSQHLHPSEAVLAHRTHACAFASESRALVSHAAILLKGFGIPSVGGLAGLSVLVHEGDRIVVDGTNALVVVRPSARTIEAYQAWKSAAEAVPGTSGVVSCRTADGADIVLRANIENPEQVKLMLAQGLDGIGLFRTEFLISEGGHIPTEEGQYEAYRWVIESAAGRPVTIRTFDIGGDKTMGLSCRCTGSNPALGVRGIRRHLTGRPEELRTQLRAALRAAEEANVRILIPMVTTLDDIKGAKTHLAEVKRGLREACVAFNPDVSFGAMVETPAAAFAVRDILAEVDFISIGTNDMLQYFMAADRDNERVIHYNDAASPAFLRLLKLIIEQARTLGREADVTVCGEVATDVRVLPHLLRMGYRSFSVSPVSATLVRSVCREFSMLPRNG